MEKLPARTRIRVKMVDGSKKIIVLPPKAATLAIGVFVTFVISLIYYIRVFIDATPSQREYIRDNPFDPFTDPWWAFYVIMWIVLFILVMVGTRQRISENFHLQISGIAYSHNNKDLFFTMDHLRSLRMRDRADGRRIFILNGNEQTELAADLSNSEREWLYKEIKEKYFP